MFLLKQARRLVLMAWVALQIFFGYWILLLRRRWLHQSISSRRWSRQHASTARLLYRTAVRHQGLLIKLGQLIGARPDIFPPEYVAELSRLHDRVPPRPYAEISSLLHRELGRSPHAIFAEFDPKPIAAASLAQVHRARLNSGEEVAVKVQYPDIEEIVRADLWGLGVVKRAVQRLLPDLNVGEIIDDLRESIPLELDFIHEGRSAENVARNFAENKTVVVPRIYWQWTTKRVLVMEFIRGIKVTDIDALRESGVDLKQLCTLFLQTYFEQIMVQGYFNADPHPGNLLVLPDGPRIALLDFGLVKKIDEHFRIASARLCRAIITFDAEATRRAYHEMGVYTREDDLQSYQVLGMLFLGLPEHIKGEKSLFDQKSWRESRIDLRSRFKSDPITHLPSDLLVMSRAITLMGGVMFTLDMWYDMWSMILGFCDRVLGQVDASKPEAQELPAAG
jgi:predicted unusual protein kinase regulating ubiquinone biosynthesis (AarF/ABC1/UbiB family)